MKVLMTGTHFTPAQAVIENLNKNKNIEIVYLGRKKTFEGDQSISIESKVLPSLGVKYVNITAGRFPRYLGLNFFLSILKIPIGFIQSFYFLLKEKPSIVVSFGGYVGLPVVISAWLLSIPILVHEQTLKFGLANKISSFFANKVAISFANIKYRFINPEKMVVSGNPLREELFKKPTQVSKDILNFLGNKTKAKKPLVLITGGNQGSHFINRAVGEIINDLTEEAFVIHQTGDSKYKDFEYLSSNLNLKNKDRYLIKKWIDVNNWTAILHEADLAISRGGANTLSELAFFSVPTICIPLASYLNHEQETNAKYFKEYGLLGILYQKDFDSKKLYSLAETILGDLKTYKQKAKQTKNIIILDASKKLTQEILYLGEMNV
ncbi:UDP-N-acetylglucosamine--N-acetylmuramyl-(pentapeptide) pyrophosphoryl-undecaprenol N-acetylglucosamine transferase [Candidatus Daviesbacteria bacterium]|nr:UDP-N-acetylglucosamine--N-acetylmuramyl-(pentapeptide) pyrophosphoryl-undecaprenol N-acetylglucosamine transferase [Candidatus Daviesbacteria bacterium]